MSAPQGTPVAPTEVGLTANGKIVAVQPWRQSTAVLAVIAQTFFVLAALANLYLAWSDVRIKGLLNDEDFSAVVREAETADGLYVPILVMAGAAGIFLLVWLHRVWTSDRSDHSLYTRGTGMAIGAGSSRSPTSSWGRSPCATCSGAPSTRARWPGPGVPPRPPVSSPRCWPSSPSTWSSAC